MDKTLQISIEDNGIGVKENQLDVIATPFKKVKVIKIYQELEWGYPTVKILQNYRSVS